MQGPSPRFRSQEHVIRRNEFTQIYRGLFGDAMLVPIRMSTNMADENQQKHLLPSFATKPWIYSLRNS